MARARIESLLRANPYLPGAVGTVRTLRLAGVHLAVISTGLHLHAEMVCAELGIDRWFANEVLFDAAGLCSGQAIEHLPEGGKGVIVGRLQVDLGIAPDETLAVTNPPHPPSTSRILLGTRNRAKIETVRAALESLPIALITLDELNIAVEVVEDGDTAQQNAEKKARAYLAASGIPTLAIDGALHVDAFPADRQPGVYVKRIHAAGGEATEESVLDYYRGALEAVGGESTGTWTAAIALALSPQRVVVDSYPLELLSQIVLRAGVFDALTAKRCFASWRASW